ncbi:hypothetical protein ACH5RR_000852 [Cinchona calisaya]|uniref:Uncharacterized protein n=1 Tax=Cinchona calisaya TaxID=153742 RepID=A0ABD3B2A6_9GENT
MHSIATLIGSTQLVSNQFEDRWLGCSLLIVPSLFKSVINTGQKESKDHTCCLVLRLEEVSLGTMQVLKYQSENLDVLYCKLDILAWWLNMVHPFNTSHWPNEPEASDWHFAPEDSNNDDAGNAAGLFGTT